MPRHWVVSLLVLVALVLLVTCSDDSTAPQETPPATLIHKAVGWSLREAGKNDPQRLERYLRTHATNIPRTTIRYAIEHFPPKKRAELLEATK